MTSEAIPGLQTLHFQIFIPRHLGHVCCRVYLPRLSSRSRYVPCAIILASVPHIPTLAGIIGFVVHARMILLMLVVLLPLLCSAACCISEGPEGHASKNHYTFPAVTISHLYSRGIILCAPRRVTIMSMDDGSSRTLK